MNQMAPIAALDTVAPLSMAVLAMGGQGGGVLVDWIVALAESEGFVAQSTSVPGVAQRTGATIYGIEMIRARPDQASPVLSLMPVPGEVDIVIGAELMEAGRAIQRGLVTPDRTVLIASSHRSYAVQEKQVPGDGIGDAGAVYAAADAAAKRLIAFDMAALAERHGSVISAVLFGALAGSGALPFPRAAFEATIRAAGVGVQPSLAAFAAGFDAAAAHGTAAPDPRARSQAPAKSYPTLSPVGDSRVDPLIVRARDAFPPALHGIVAAGLARVIDYQDPDYGREYLELITPMLSLGSGNLAFAEAAAKYVAVAMAYDDVIRVADLKLRRTRFARIRQEAGAAPGQIVRVTEFMHPRAEEIVGLMPAGLGRFIEARPRLFQTIDRLVNKGRRVRSDTLRWHLALGAVAGLRRIRRITLRHAQEVAHRDAWLAAVRRAAGFDVALATEMLRARRLVKGYSDTHARGSSKFDRVLAAVPMLEGRADASEWLARLVRAALQDEAGTALDGALQTVASFSSSASRPHD